MFKKLGEMLRGMWESHCEIQARMYDHPAELIPHNYFIPNNEGDKNVRDH